jgi:diguanylate cyclase (GGDEF)-like protein/PAS domain S-box-containing protein
MPNGGWVATFEDITEQLRIEQERDRNRDFLDQIIENVPAAIFVKNVDDRKYVLANRAAEKFWGASRADILGKTAYEVFLKEEADLIAARDEDLLQANALIFDEREINFAGGRRNISSRRLTIQDSKGNARYLLGVIEDVTERKRTEQRIAHLAHYDALTDLPNRVLLREKLEQELAFVRRGAQLAVLYLDLDHFKSVNDTLGHSTGDELLKAVTARMRGCLRACDIFARLGGDEFAIVQTGIEHPTDAAALAQRIRDAITQTCYDLNGHQVVVDISIGIALAPDDGTEADQLLKYADMALYGAKADGRGTFRYFEAEMDARMKTRRSLEIELRKALLNNEFELHYQPIVRFADNAVSGCEALLRWHHPERGMIPPADFIPVAEETGLINAIGEWVLRQACAEAATWPDDIKIAVNASPVQFRSQDLPQAVINALTAANLAPHRLELEITESVLMQSNDTTLRRLHQLRELGVRISMDDFGTGHSSLSYLRSFPLDKIKIDRSFVNDLSNGNDGPVIMQAILTLANSLNMTTTAEGVETEPQAELLRAMGCVEMQGFLFSAPKPRREIANLLASHTKGIASAA